MKVPDQTPAVLRNLRQGRNHPAARLTELTMPSSSAPKNANAVACKRPGEITCRGNDPANPPICCDIQKEYCSIDSSGTPNCKAYAAPPVGSVRGCLLPGEEFCFALKTGEQFCVNTV